MEHVDGVWAVRSAASMFGHAEAWCKEDGRPLEFESLEAAQALSLIHISLLQVARGLYSATQYEG